MCVIVDTNCIPHVFSRSSDRHRDFSPVTQWITRGSGRLVYGGKKYKGELRLMTRYHQFIGEMKRCGRVVEIEDARVDKLAAELKLRVPDLDFNDEHLVAIVAASGCCIVCTDDKPASKFLKLKHLYPLGVKPPKIYNKLSHKKLCCSNYTADICRKGPRTLPLRLAK